AEAARARARAPRPADRPRHAAARPVARVRRPANRPDRTRADDRGGTGSVRAVRVRLRPSRPGRPRDHGHPQRGLPPARADDAMTAVPVRPRRAGGLQRAAMTPTTDTSELGTLPCSAGPLGTLRARPRAVLDTLVELRPGLTSHTRS